MAQRRPGGFGIWQHQGPIIMRKFQPNRLHLPSPNSVRAPRLPCHFFDKLFCQRQRHQVSVGSGRVFLLQLSGNRIAVNVILPGAQLIKQKRSVFPLGLLVTFPVIESGYSAQPNNNPGTMAFPCSFQNTLGSGGIVAFNPLE